MCGQCDDAARKDDDRAELQAYRAQAINSAACDLDLRRDIAKVLNRYSRENGSDTADYILAEYLCACLDAYDYAIKARDRHAQGT